MIAVVDYDAGNLRSVETALRHLGARFAITADPGDVERADRVIVPGVGDGAHAMGVLRERGLDVAIRAAAGRGAPTLGICLGSQIVLERTEERDAACLGLIPGIARLFPPTGGFKVPHMGWNQVSAPGNHWLFHRIPAQSSFYFVHSYYPAPSAREHVVATTEYSIAFASAIEAGPVAAVQFHPEKSGEVGLQMLRNFLTR